MYTGIQSPHELEQNCLELKKKLPEANDLKLFLVQSSLQYKLPSKSEIYVKRENKFCIPPFDSLD